MLAAVLTARNQRANQHQPDNRDERYAQVSKKH